MASIKASSIATGQAGDEEGLQPMQIAASQELGNKAEAEEVNALASSTTEQQDFRAWFERQKSIHVPRRYRLIQSVDARRLNTIAVRFAVVAASISTKMLNPNYPIMVSPDVGHPESFPSTEPLGFNSATYFLPMCSLLGVAISSVFLGQISDRLGRKKVMIALAVISVAGNIVKYYTRYTFWGFCIAQFVFGLFLGNLPVAMAYVGDIFTSKKEREDQLSRLVSMFVMGNSGGGIIAILMNGSGLFAPLWVGAGLSVLSAILLSAWMIDPGDERLKPIGKELLQDECDEDNQELARPETIDHCTMWNVVGGALADNFGSTALFPLCLSPLALQVYTLPFYEQGADPILSITGYQWLSVMVAGMVVPSTFLTPHMFSWLGVAGTCVIGNFFTGVLTFSLLLIGTYAVRPYGPKRPRASIIFFKLPLLTVFLSAINAFTARYDRILCRFCGTNVSGRHLFDRRL